MSKYCEKLSAIQVLELICSLLPATGALFVAEETAAPAWAMEKRLMKALSMLR